MNTINGVVEDTGGHDTGILITVTSQSTPQSSGGIVVINTITTLRSDPTTGAFVLSLLPGQYQVVFGPTTQHPSTTVTIAVPVGSATYNFADVVSSSQAVIPGNPPYTNWNGQWAGHINFLPQAAPAVPTESLVAYTGGNISASGNERYSYFISWTTANGETSVSPVLAVHESGTPAADKANRITFPAAPATATGVRVWRTYVDTGSPYDVTTFPVNVGLLATTAAGAAFYDDWESTTAFAGRVDTTIQVPLYNTTAGQLQVNGVPVCEITPQGAFYFGSNFRIIPGKGVQLYNFTTGLWYTIGCFGALTHEQILLDAGNPN